MSQNPDRAVKTSEALCEKLARQGAQVIVAQSAPSLPGDGDRRRPAGVSGVQLPKTVRCDKLQACRRLKDRWQQFAA